MKPLRFLLPLIFPVLPLIVVAQPVPPVIGDTGVSGGEFRFTIGATTGSNCVVQTSTNNSTGVLFWTDVGPAGSSFVTPVVSNGVPHHFRIRCEQDGSPFFSVNLATYYYVSPPPGFSMLSYPLETVSNSLSNLLPTVSEGTMLHWFDPAVQQLETVQFEFGQWSDPQVQMPRGRAVLLWSPVQPKGFVLHGTFSAVQHTNYMATGFNLLSPAWPFGSSVPSEFLCNDRTALELIDTDGIDPVYRSYVEVPPDWYDEQFNPHPPPFPVFGGLWIFRPCPSSVWVETRTVPFLETSCCAKSLPENTPKASGTASVYFNNYVPGFGIDARIVHTNGTVPSGSNWLAQLYAGAPGDAENDLIAAGDPLPFFSESLAGYLDTSAGATRLVTNAAADGDSIGQIRYWDVRTGSNYDAATMKGSTPIFLIPIRFAATTPPAPMLGLTSPRLQLSRNAAAAGARLSLHGYAGMSYLVEGTSTLTNWNAFSVIADTNPALVWIDVDLSTNQYQFFRARIAGPAQ